MLYFVIPSHFSTCNKQVHKYKSSVPNISMDTASYQGSYLDFTLRYVPGRLHSCMSLSVQCYSKFGDVVFTLTRFFRDRKSRKSTMLQLSHTEDHPSFNGNDSISCVLYETPFVKSVY